MAKYLSDQWFEEMSGAAATFRDVENAERKISLREIVTDTPFGDVSYLMTIENGLLSIVRDDPDGEVEQTAPRRGLLHVTFRQDYDTAVALHRGELSPNDAFFAGRVRVAGHLNTLLENADLLQGIAPVFESVRSTTTY